MIITAYHQLRLNERDEADQIKDFIEPGAMPSTEEITQRIYGKIDEFDPDIPLNKILTEVEMFCISRALNLSGGNKARAARILGLQRTTLIEKLRKWCLGMDEELPDDELFDPTKTTFLLEVKWMAL